MRLLLDTCIIAFMALEPDRLSEDVLSLIEDYDNQLCVSMESVKELIVAYRRKGIGRKIWKKEEDIIQMIKDDLCIQILPIREEHIRTYARLTINEAQGHNDPSDHIIIAHAITEHIPLVSSDHKFDFYIKQGGGSIWKVQAFQYGTFCRRHKQLICTYLH